MIIEDKNIKEELLKKMFGKYEYNCIKGHKKMYEDIYNMYEFIQNNGLTFSVKIPQFKGTQILYYNNLNNRPPQLTEKIFVDYMIKEYRDYDKDSWLNEDKLGYYVSREKTNESLRKLRQCELEDLNSIMQKQRELKTKNAKNYYGRFKDIITFFEIWN